MPSNAMATGTDVQLVIGYFKGIQPPSETCNAEISSRLSVSFFQEDPIFRLHFMQIFFENLRKNIPHDALTIVSDEKTFDSLEKWVTFTTAQPLTDSVLPERLIFMKKGHLVSLVETEWWSRAGGPYPFSDLDTLAIYVHETMVENLMENLKKICKQNGALFEVLASGTSTYIPLQWWQRLLLWVK